jgi:DNA-binding Xre family transcriptional regulator
MEYKAELVKERINIALTLRGMSKKELNEKVGINKNSIAQMTDAKGISSFTLAKIADCLDVSTDYLLGRDSTPIAKNNEELYSLILRLPEQDIDEMIHFAEILLARQSQAGSKG